jgi:hypothetical protein
MDSDNDGDQDLLVGVGSGNPSQLLINDFGDLANRTAELGLTYATNVSIRLPVWLDYNNDSLPDVFMVNHRGAGLMFQQARSGFTATTNAVGVTCAKFHYGQLYDANNDGRIDLLCGGQEKSTASSFPQAAYNTRYLPFRDITAAMMPISKTLDTALADFDGDAREDVFAVRGVLRPSGVSQQGRTIEALLIAGSKGFKFTSTGKITVELHWNKTDETAGLPNIKVGAGGFNPGTTTFTLDPADPAVAGAPSYSAADVPLITISYDPTAHEWNFTNDSGKTFSNAYFIVKSDANVTGLRALGLWPSDGDTLPALVLNKSGGPVDDTVHAGLDVALSCISTVAGDFDNDMDVDIYAACRAGPRNIPNVVFENQGDGTFVARTDIGDGAGPLGLAVSEGAGTADTVVAADYDVDGFLDLYLTNGFNMRPVASGGPESLLHNRGNANHWVEIDLVATHSMRDALGARVFATTAGGKKQVRSANGGYHRWAQDAKRLHFGLAANTEVDLEVQWPSGTVDTFQNVGANALYRIEEGSSGDGSGRIHTVTLGNGQPLPCGAPPYSRSTETGVALWKDCGTQTWKLRAVAGTASTRYQGRLESNSALTLLKAAGLESSDILDADPSPNVAAFTFDVGRGTQDGIDVRLATGAGACLDINTNGTKPKVWYGPLRAELALPFDLFTGGACTP